MPTTNTTPGLKRLRKAKVALAVRKATLADQRSARRAAAAKLAATAPAPKAAKPAAESRGDPSKPAKANAAKAGRTLHLLGKASPVPPGHRAGQDAGAGGGRHDHYRARSRVQGGRTQHQRGGLREQRHGARGAVRQLAGAHRPTAKGPPARRPFIFAGSLPNARVAAAGGGTGGCEKSEAKK